MPPPGPELSSAKILLVDDEVDILSSFQLFLEKAIPGLKVTTAENGAAGLEAMKATKFDLIIADYKMPGMDGLEFLRRAEAMAPDTPRMLITAFPKLELAVQAINEVNVDKFFTKPLQPDQLAQAVRSLIRRRDVAQGRPGSEVFSKR